MNSTGMAALIAGPAHTGCAVLLVLMTVTLVPCTTRATAALERVPAGMATAAEAAPEEGTPEFATPTTLDRAGRIVAPVEINGRGPFRFILDTGANRSAMGNCP